MLYSIYGFCKIFKPTKKSRINPHKESIILPHTLYRRQGNFSHKQEKNYTCKLSHYWQSTYTSSLWTTSYSVQFWPSWFGPSPGLSLCGNFLLYKTLFIWDGSHVWHNKNYYYLVIITIVYYGSLVNQNSGLLGFFPFFEAQKEKLRRISAEFY